MKTSEVILHIGLHKTGSSSFQAVMAHHGDEFLAAGIAPYISPTGKSHSKEISLAILRDGVFETPGKDEMLDVVRQQIDDFMATSVCNRFLFSSEHYSLIRTDAEAQKLRSLFTAADPRFRVLLVVRDKRSWFESYKAQVLRSGDRPSSDTRSANYLEAGSWLLQFDTMIDVFRRNFGEVTIIDYDERDAITPLLSAMGVRVSFNPKVYRRNRSPESSRLGSAKYKVARAVFGSEHRGMMRFWRDLRERVLR